MANGAFNFKDGSGNIVSFISGSGSDIIISGGTLDLSSMTGLTLGGLTMSGTTDILAYIASAIIGVALLIIIFKILGSIIYAKKQSL